MQTNVWRVVAGHQPDIDVNVTQIVSNHGQWQWSKNIQANLWQIWFKAFIWLQLLWQWRRQPRGGKPRQQPRLQGLGLFRIKHLPAAMIWNIQGCFCSPTRLLLQHINVPYSNVLVGVNVSTLFDPFVRMNLSSTTLASAELLNVHLQRFQITKRSREQVELLALPHKTTKTRGSATKTYLKVTSGGFASTLQAMWAVSRLATP